MEDSNGGEYLVQKEAETRGDKRVVEEAEN